VLRRPRRIATQQVVHSRCETQYKERMTTPSSTLVAIFEAERALRTEERTLLAAEPSALRALLSAAVAQAKALEDRAEATLRLERLADLCAQVEGPEMVDALVAILDDEAPSVRVQAAEALVDVGFERYAELARGIERAIADGARSTALQELPWVLVEIAEPSARQLIARLLKQDDVEVVASAVEALAELGDPAAIADLEALRDDERPVALEDEDDEAEEATLGDLVEESIAALQGDDN
jgi:HEAT repeat protein